MQKIIDLVTPYIRPLSPGETWGLIMIITGIILLVVYGARILK